MSHISNFAAWTISWKFYSSAAVLANCSCHTSGKLICIVTSMQLIVACCKLIRKFWCRI